MEEAAFEEHGVSETRFLVLKKGLDDAGKVSKSAVDEKWEQIRPDSRNWYEDKDQ